MLAAADIGLDEPELAELVLFTSVFVPAWQRRNACVARGGQCNAKIESGQNQLENPTQA